MSGAGFTYTHPPQCRCRSQQLPSGRLRHRDHVFRKCGTKNESCTQNNRTESASQWWFTEVRLLSLNTVMTASAHLRRSSDHECWIAEWDQTRRFSVWFRQSLLLPSHYLVWAMCATLPSMPVSTLPGICLALPSSHLCEHSQTGTDGRQPSASTVHPKENAMFWGQILSLQPSHPTTLLETHQLSKDFGIASR